MNPERMGTKIFDGMAEGKAEAGRNSNRYRAPGGFSETAFLEPEDEFRLLAENATLGIVIVMDGRFEYVNPHYARIFEYRPEELVGKRGPADLLVPEDRPIYEENLRKRILLGEPSVHYEARGVSRSGRVIHLEIYGARILHKGRTAVMGTVIDISGRKRAEQALRESEEKYRLLVQNAGEAIFILQGDSIRFANRRMQEQMGRSAEEFSRIPFSRFIHPEDREAVLDRYRRRLAGESLPVNQAFRVMDQGGREVWVEVNSVAIPWEGRPATLNFGRDITLQKKMEAQLLQAQKMEAVGTLAGGIAHDFNNLLMAIQGNLSLLLLDTPATQPHRRYLETIGEQVKSAAGLSGQLLSFARRGKREIVPSDLSRIVKKTAEMFARTKKEIRIHEDYAAGLWTAEVDPGQIEQALLNLLVNAWQAMPAGGDLFLETQNAVFDEQFLRPFSAPPGKYVMVAVTDTGLGMDEETQRRIFEPFFTTQEMGRGTGLGLAMVYGIVKGHGGFITVYSQKGEGSVFKVYFPASDQEARKEEKKGPGGLMRGSETILLVEDEEAVMRACQMILERLGYRVIPARSGPQALDLYRRGREGIHLVILDMVMPGQGGGETFEQLKELNPQVKVLLSSGYSLNSEAARILERGCKDFIEKPFNLEDLSAKIRKILDPEE